MKLQFCSIAKWILVCLVAVAAPAGWAFEDQIKRGIIKTERGALGILSLRDQRKHVGRREKPERAEHETLSVASGPGSSAKFLLADNDKDEKRARRRKRKSGDANEFRGSANNLAEDDGAKWRKRSKRAVTKGTQTNDQKLIKTAKQSGRLRAVNIQRKGANGRRVGGSQQKQGKNSYWNRLQAAKTAPKRTNQQQAAYPEYPNYGNRPRQGQPGGQDYFAPPQYPSGGGNPIYNYPTVQRNDLTTMLFTFKGPQATLPSQNIYGVQTQTPPPFFPGLPDPGGGGARPPRRRFTNGPGDNFPRRNGTKVNRFRKRFQYMQLNSPDEILVAWPFARPHNVVTVLLTAMPPAGTKPATRASHPKGTAEAKKPSTKKAPPTKATTTKPAPTSPTSTTTTSTTTEMMFTEVAINGSTVGLAVDINRFVAPSEQPMTMGFNIDEEFTGVILTDAATGSRRGKSADDSNKFELMQGVLQGIIITSPPPDVSELEDILKDIKNANKDILAKETTRPTTTTTKTVPPTTVAVTTHVANSAAVPGSGHSPMGSTLPASSTVQSTTPGGTRPMTAAQNQSTTAAELSID